MVPFDETERVGAILTDKTESLQNRFRSLFTLKHLKGPNALKSISACFSDESPLLKHELAYCLGQMQDREAIPKLIEILQDRQQETVVRHEAAEALAAIGDPIVKKTLEMYKSHAVMEIAQTCEIGLERLQWLENGGIEVPNKYGSIDPAPPSVSLDVDSLRAQLLDENLPIFERYRAMFALRDLDNLPSIIALVKGLTKGTALFRHEIAFVLGQLKSQLTVNNLLSVLENAEEHEMVRHECAEALGAIGMPDSIAVLKTHATQCESRLVRESCQVAIDMCQHYGVASNELHYADGLIRISSN